MQAAAYWESETIVRLLLDRGAKVNDHEGGLSSRALQIADDRDYKGIVQLLLDHGAIYPEKQECIEH